MGGEGRTVEERIAQKPSSQHGVVTGVFRVGHAAFSLEATYLAAVFACGDGSLLSGHAAGYLWRTLKGRPPIPEVTAPTERRIEGVRTHRSRSIHPSDRAVVRGIPVTSVPATV